MVFRRITRGWNEHGSYGSNVGFYERWRTATSGVSWTTPGGDFSESIATNPGGGASPPCWSKTTLSSAAVQNWIRSPASNFGFMMRNESAVNDGVTYYSSHYQTLNQTPKLTITYTSNGTYVVPGSARIESQRSMFAVSGHRITFMGPAYSVMAVSFHTLNGALLNAQECGTGEFKSWDLSQYSQGLFVIQWRYERRTDTQTASIE